MEMCRAKVEMESIPEEIVEKDLIVLKRLKFVFKIIKAVPLQSNGRNRHAFAYVSEVLDTISDWSGNQNDEIIEYLDKRIFPLICRLVSTLSKEEFITFQCASCKYLFSKWEETSSFIALDFLAEIYGFIARIAPNSIVVELVQVFQQEHVPSHAYLLVLPTIIKNLDGSASDDLKEKLLRNLHLRQNNMLESNLKTVALFWINLKQTVCRIQNLHQITPMILKCILTSSYMDLIDQAIMEKILQGVTECANSIKTPLQVNSFLIVSSIYLHSLCSVIFNQQNHVLLKPIMNLMSRVTQLIQDSRNERVRCLSVMIFQRILEHAGDNSLDEVLENFQKMSEQFEFNDGDRANALLIALEQSVKQIKDENPLFDDDNKKRISVMIDSLQNILQYSN